MKKLIFLTLMLFPSAVQARPLTLQEVVEFVQKNHPAVAAAEWDIKEAKAAKKAEAWLPDPMVGIQFEEVPLENPGLGNAEMRNYFASQEIPFPGTLAAKSSALKSEVKAKQSMKLGAVQMAIFDAKQTFLGLVAVYQQMQNKKAALGSYQQLVAALSQKYESGQGSRSSKNLGMQIPDAGMGEDSLFGDLLMAKMKKAEVETVIYDLNHKRETLLARLNLLLEGYGSQTPITSLVLPPLKKLKFDEEMLEEKFLSQNADLKALEWMVKKAKKDVGLAAMNLIPTIEPEFMYQQRKDMENAYTLGIGLNIPIWINRNKAEIDRAKAAHLRTKAELENQKLNLQTTLHNLIHHAEEHYKIVKKYEGEIVPLARAAFNAAQTAYEGKMISSSSLLQKLVNYHEASKMYWEMWEDYQVEYAMLEQFVGEEL